MIMVQKNLQPYTDKHGLPDNTIYSILEDDQKHLWLGTRNGISRFDPVKKTFTNYDYKDGLQGNHFAAVTGIASQIQRQGWILYFGGENGFNFFDPCNDQSQQTNWRRW